MDIVPHTRAPSSDADISAPISRSSTPQTSRSLLFDDIESEAPFYSSIQGDFVLVVGGLGYIGSHTSWELLKAGMNVIIIDNLSNSFKGVLDRLELLRSTHYRQQSDDVVPPVLHFYEADYRDRCAMRALLSKYNHQPGHLPGSPSSSSAIESAITGVIHFAAYKSVSESFQNPLAYYANNVGGMVDFCNLLGELNITTFVFSSSATVYGEFANKGGRLIEEYCDNRGCTGLTNPYGRTKWMCEAILDDLAVSDSRWSIIALRYFNPIGCDESGVLGEDPRDTPNNLMPVVVKVMTGELERLNVYGTDWNTADGTAIRDFIHVSDLARGHLAALTARNTLGQGFKKFNLGTGTGHSVQEIITSMERVSGKSIPVHKTGRREGDVAICIAEPSNSMRSLNWRTNKTLDDCCRDICRFLNLDVSAPQPPREESQKRGTISMGSRCARASGWSGPRSSSTLVCLEKSCGLFFSALFLFLLLLV